MPLHACVWYKPTEAELLLTSCYEALEHDVNDRAANLRLGNFLLGQGRSKLELALCHLERAGRAALAASKDGKHTADEVALFRRIGDARHRLWLEQRAARAMRAKARAEATDASSVVAGVECNGGVGSANGGGACTYTRGDAQRLLRALFWWESSLRAIRKQSLAPGVSAEVKQPANPNVHDADLLLEMVRMCVELGDAADTLPLDVLGGLGPDRAHELELEQQGKRQEYEGSQKEEQNKAAMQDEVKESGQPNLTTHHADISDNGDDGDEPLLICEPELEHGFKLGGGLQRCARFVSLFLAVNMSKDLRMTTMIKQPQHPQASCGDPCVSRYTQTLLLAASLLGFAGRYAQGRSYLNDLFERPPESLHPFSRTDVQLYLCRCLDRQRNATERADVKDNSACSMLAACYESAFDALQSQSLEAKERRAAVKPPPARKSASVEAAEAASAKHAMVGLAIDRAVSIVPSVPASSASDAARLAATAVAMADATAKNAQDLTMHTKFMLVRAQSVKTSGSHNDSASSEQWRQWVLSPRTWEEASVRFSMLGDPLAALDAARYGVKLASKQGLSVMHQLQRRCTVDIRLSEADDALPQLLCLVGQCLLRLGHRQAALRAAADALEAGPYSQALREWLLVKNAEAFDSEPKDDNDTHSDGNVQLVEPLADERVPLARIKQQEINAHLRIVALTSACKPTGVSARRAAHIHRSALCAAREGMMQPTFRAALGTFDMAATKIQALARRAAAVDFSAATRVGRYPASKLFRRIRLLQACARGMMARSAARNDHDMRLAQKGCIILQARVRGRRHRAHVARANAMELAATVLCAMARGAAERRRVIRAYPESKLVVGLLVEHAVAEDQALQDCKRREAAAADDEHHRAVCSTNAATAIARIVRGCTTRWKLRRDPRRRRWCERGVWVESQNMSKLCSDSTTSHTKGSPLKVQSAAAIRQRKRRYSWQLPDRDADAEAEAMWASAVSTRAAYISVMQEVLNPHPMPQSHSHKHLMDDQQRHWAPFAITSDAEVKNMLCKGHMLVVSSPCWGFSDTLRLGTALRRYRPRLSLHTIMLYGCRLGDEGARVLFSALSGSKPAIDLGQGSAVDELPLRCLCLGGNGLSISGARSLVVLLERQRIRKLAFEDQPAIGPEGMSVLAPALARAALRGLEQLTLTGLCAGNRGIVALANAIGDANDELVYQQKEQGDSTKVEKRPSLQLLSLRHNGITDKGGVALVRCLRACTAFSDTLRVLHLGGNRQIANGTARQLSLAMMPARAVHPLQLTVPDNENEREPECADVMSGSIRLSSEDKIKAALARRAEAAPDVVDVGQQLSVSWRLHREVELDVETEIDFGSCSSISVVDDGDGNSSMIAPLRLRELELSGTGVGDDGACMLAAASLAQWPGTSTAEHFGGTGAARMFCCPLQRLSMQACPAIGADGVAELAAAQGQLQRASLERGVAPIQLATLLLDKTNLRISPSLLHRL
eukprot:g912.t1